MRNYSNKYELETENADMLNLLSADDLLRFEARFKELLIVTPLQKIHIIEPFVASVGFVHNVDGEASCLRNLSIEEYRAEKEAEQEELPA